MEHGPDETQGLASDQEPDELEQNHGQERDELEEAITALESGELAVESGPSTELDDALARVEQAVAKL